MAKQDVPKVVKLDDPSKWAILRVETGQSFRMKMDGPLIYSDESERSSLVNMHDLGSSMDRPRIVHFLDRPLLGRSIFMP